MITVIRINGSSSPSPSASSFSSSSSSSSSSPSSSNDFRRYCRRFRSADRSKQLIESDDEGFSENQSLTGSLTIKGPTGSVRGFKHCVRQTISTYYNFITNQESKNVRNYEKEEINVCVLYTTSMGIIRSTFENCRKLKAILFQNLIDFEERDVYLNAEFRNELEERCKKIIVPSLFVNGKFFGDTDCVERLNECGKLSHLLIDFKMSMSPKLFRTCVCCGNARFIPCSTCNGSKKTFIHHFSCDSITLRCSQCNATGLIKCPICFAFNNRR